MNQSISLSDLNPLKLAKALKHYVRPLIWLIVVGLFCYSGYQISQISKIGPDPGYLQANQNKQKVINLKSNQAVINELRTLNSSGDTTIPINPGKHNPFSLQ